MTGLERARRRRGWNQTVAAYMGGTTQSWISKYEHRVATPGSRVAARLARALGIEPAELTAEVADEQRSHTTPA